MPQTPLIALAAGSIRSDGTMTEEPRDDKGGDWRIWPPSPKVQILLIVAVFGLINLCLLAIFGFVLIRRYN